MLPKTGIYSLPDFRVLGYLRFLTDRQQELMAEQRYKESEQVAQKFKVVGKIEVQRQMKKMEHRQAEELRRIEAI